ncbi:MAG: carboxypeptidase regulatory-like domain-containing protein [Acidobacteriia bacterium]|nr:carboxypeptidase regulatory-like domain-containing protein [Terriglobia bacterium]
MKAVLAILAAGLASLSAQVVLGPPGRPAPQPEVGKAAIQGKVLDALTREPVRKASVTLNGRSNLTAVTDAAGQFAFRKLPAGQYMLRAQSVKYPNAVNVYDAAWQISVTVTAEEEKSDVELLLTPGGSLSGRILDEEGSPMPRCLVRATQFYDTGTRLQVLASGGTSQSDDKGEYRMENIPAGKYYVQAKCSQFVPLPHALLRRDEARNAPALIYPARLFPGAAELSSATRIAVTPGSTITAIDFHMIPATGMTVRGRAHPVPSNAGQLLLQLRPKDASPLENRPSASVDPNTGEFRFSNVPPGSYAIVTSNPRGDCACFASVPVEVGATAPDPVDVLISPMPQLMGTLSFEDGDKPEGVIRIEGPPQNSRSVMLTPLDDQFGGPPLPAQVQSDGTFVVTAPPGRWQVRVNGAPGYVKSVKLGDQEVPPDDLETGAAPAALQIVMSTKFAPIEGTVSGVPAGSGMVSGMLWPAASFGSQQFFGMNPQGSVTLSVPPGRYYACAVAITQPSMLIQNPALLKALEGRCATVEAVAGDRATFTMKVISADELKRVQDSLDSDPATPQ